MPIEPTQRTEMQGRKADASPRPSGGKWVVVVLFGRTRTVAAADVDAITTKTGMTAGATVYTDIRIVRQGVGGRWPPAA